MLTSDLLRFSIDDRTITPRYIKRKHAETYLRIASDLLNIYQAHINKPRCELDKALTDYESDRVGYKILRGLAKMLDGFAEYEPLNNFDYPDLRRQLFSFAEKHRPVVRKQDLIHRETREIILAKFAAETSLEPDELYGDLPEKHILVALQKDVEPVDLIRRYNLALAQGILYRCTRIAVKVWDGYKIIFRYLKLAQLIHKVHKEDDHYLIEIDGPFSLFRKTQKYGVNLARFLPALLLADKWQMWAWVNTYEGERCFVLDQNCGLVSHYKKGHPFDSSVEEAFYNNFSKRKKNPWQILQEAEILDIGENVLIPDFKLMHPGGHEVLLEIVGFWTPEYLNKKIEKLSQVRLNNLIIAVNENLNCSKEDFTGHVIFYKNRLKVKDVLETLNRIFPIENQTPVRQKNPDR